MEIAIRKDEEIARFTIGGNIDEKGAEDLKTRFRELNVSSLKEVVFDFASVNHIGSAGMGKLLLFYKDLAPHGGLLKIENATATVYELFKAVKLDTLFSISKA